MAQILGTLVVVAVLPTIILMRVALDMGGLVVVPMVKNSMRIIMHLLVQLIRVAEAEPEVTMVFPLLIPVVLVALVL